VFTLADLQVKVFPVMALRVVFRMSCEWAGTSSTRGTSGTSYRTTACIPRTCSPGAGTSARRSGTGASFHIPASGRHYGTPTHGGLLLVVTDAWYGNAVIRPGKTALFPKSDYVITADMTGARTPDSASEGRTLVGWCGPVPECVE
jgi:hypothetical protein